MNGYEKHGCGPTPATGLRQSLQTCRFVISRHKLTLTMDLRGIRSFVHIAELGSITRAAQHLRVAHQKKI